MRSRFSIFTVIVGVLFFGLLIIFRSSAPVGYLRWSILQVISPVARIAQNTGQSSGFGLVGWSRERVRALEEDSSRLKAANARVQELERENESLARALGVRAEFGPRIKSARAISYQQVMGRESLVIDLGRDAGVAAGDIVMDENRLLLGEVAETGIGFSKVAVASNPGIAFSAVLQPLGGKVLVKGLGARALGLELIPYDAPVRSGDFVVLFDENQRVLPAVFAARVVATSTAGASAAFKTGRATLLSDPERVQMVMVLTKNRNEK